MSNGILISLGCLVLVLMEMPSCGQPDYHRFSVFVSSLTLFLSIASLAHIC